MLFTIMNSQTSFELVLLLHL